MQRAQKFGLRWRTSDFFELSGHRRREGQACEGNNEQLLAPRSWCQQWRRRANHDLPRASRESHIEMLRSHTLGLKNDCDVSLQSFQKKRASNGAPAQRPTHMAVPFAGEHHCADKATFALGCPKR